MPPFHPGTRPLSVNWRMVASREPHSQYAELSPGYWPSFLPYLDDQSAHSEALGRPISFQYHSGKYRRSTTFTPRSRDSFRYSTTSPIRGSGVRPVRSRSAMTGML